MKTIVTVFSDASLDNSKCGCGWWFKSNGVSGMGSMQMSAENLSIHEAELWGIRCAILDACVRHQGSEIILVVQCDNIGALQTILVLNARRSKGDPRVYWAKNSPLKQHGLRKSLSENEVKWLQDIRECGATNIYLKHVKGHSKSTDARSSVNKLTDKLASQARKQP